MTAIKFENRNSNLHYGATIGFGRAAVAYGRVRPEYWNEAVRDVLNRLYLFSSGLRVMDLAAGTGKFTKVLAGLAARAKSIEGTAEKISADASKDLATEPTVKI